MDIVREVRLPGRRICEQSAIKGSRANAPLAEHIHMRRHYSLPLHRMRIFSDLNEVDRSALKQSQALFNLVTKHVPAHAPSAKPYQELADELAMIAGLPKDSLHVAIFESEDPNAYIVPILGEIRITSALIETLEHRKDLLSAIIAHEIGHLLLEHYALHPNDTMITESDRLRKHIDSYESEYQADRISAILLSRLSYPTGRMNLAFEKIEDALKKAKENKDGDLVNEEGWILSTHPHTGRRKISLNRLNRLLSDGKSDIDARLPEMSDSDWITPEVAEEELDFYFRENFTDLDYVRIACAWEEEILQDETVKAGRLRMYTPHQLIEHYVLRDIEAVGEYPSCLAASEAEKMAGKEEIEGWWAEALNMVHTTDDLDDLIQEISGYTPETIKRLLAGIPLTKYLDSSLSSLTEYSERHPDEFEVTKKSSMPVQVFVVTSLLFRHGFLAGEPSAESIQDAFEFLRKFREGRGCSLPYDKGMLLSSIKKSFSVSGDERKGILAGICRDYIVELRGGHLDDHTGLLPFYLREMNAWLEMRGEDPIPIVPLLQEVGGKSCKGDLVVLLDGNASQTEIRDFIRNKLVPYFQNRNLTDETIDFLKHAEDSEEYDRARETDLDVAATLLSEEEFEREYFGEGRDKYKKSEYVLNKTGIGNSTVKLWKKAGYPEEMKELGTGTEKVKFISDTCPGKSARRDQVIVAALGWHPLDYLEDLLPVQDRISQEEDPQVLLELSEAFSNDLLALTVAQRLWDLSRDQAAFRDALPSAVKKKASEEFSALDIRDNIDLETLLVCFPQASYVRDELLRQFIDSAPDERTTLAIASLLSDPPAGTLRKRQTTSVLLSESALDAITKMETVDKEEMLLYLLGHNLFYSGIDAHFFADMRDETAELRRDTLYRTGTRRRVKTHETELEWVDCYEEEDKPDKYEVSRPDSLIRLSKAAGVPIELIYRQQKTVASRREQRDLLEYALIGKNGILRNGNGNAFLEAAAKTIVHKGSLGKTKSEKTNEAICELLVHALKNCPEKKLADLFLDAWYLNAEKGEIDLPDMVVRLMQNYGAVFIKAGQYLSTQTNSLPQEWTQAFRKLTDQNREADKTLLYEQEYASYGRNSPLRSLGRKLGEGSMAAVYAGELHDGTKIAAKVLHPNIAKELDEDTEFLRKMVDFINENRKTYGVLLPNNLHEIMREQISEELSLSTEASNQGMLNEVLRKEADGVSFDSPSVFEEHSTHQFLVMQLAEGSPLDGQELSEVESKKLRNAVGLEIYRQILSEGIYQADPNLGNFSVKIVKGKPRVSWLDTGNVGKLSKTDRELIKRFIYQAIFDSRPEVMAPYLSQLLNVDQKTQEEATPIIAAWLASSASGFSFSDLGPSLNSFFEFCDHHGYVMKGKWVQLLKTIGLTKPLLCDLESHAFVFRLIPLLEKEMQISKPK